MKEKLFIHYDDEGDFLEFRIGSPKEAYFEEVEEDVFQRCDEKTNEVKGFAIFNFKKRTENLKDIAFSLPFKIQIN
ncbi:MAG TPA: hypothetical protein VJB94_00520 [Candidatus Nanoarchaeia archaeon]|nr:hypothetical protein [Candidatus Nanoarchaeia archaeon]